MVGGLFNKPSHQFRSLILVDVEKVELLMLPFSDRLERFICYFQQVLVKLPWITTSKSSVVLGICGIILGGYVSIHKKHRQMSVVKATVKATAQGIPSMACTHGPKVEWRTCIRWKTVYSIIFWSSFVIDLEVIVATPLQLSIVSWNLYMSLLKVHEHPLPEKPNEASHMKMFVANSEASFERTFLVEYSFEQPRKPRYVCGSDFKNLVMVKIRTMFHCILKSCAIVDLASILFFGMLIGRVSQEAQLHVGKES
ncbi:hypothetical protein L6452_42121 [Arctium lappa]|uniref:Uncharacterized protein n=1 Tax=Arctium lappa TaxID=4217 RepID=A0ACB8XGW0_ARCLA|nr:hypothetical protein L6452_42121 [Arctium lappa]